MSKDQNLETSFILNGKTIKHAQHWNATERARYKKYMQREARGVITKKQGRHLDSMKREKKWEIFYLVFHGRVDEVIFESSRLLIVGTIIAIIMATMIPDRYHEITHQIEHYVIGYAMGLPFLYWTSESKLVIMQLVRSKEREVRMRGIRMMIFNSLIAGIAVAVAIGVHSITATPAYENAVAAVGATDLPFYLVEAKATLHMAIVQVAQQISLIDDQITVGLISYTTGHMHLSQTAYILLGGSLALNLFVRVLDKRDIINSWYFWLLPLGVTAYALNVAGIEGAISGVIVASFMPTSTIEDFHHEGVVLFELILGIFGFTAGGVPMKASIVFSSTFVEAFRSIVVPLSSKVFGLGIPLYVFRKQVGLDDQKLSTCMATGGQASLGFTVVLFVLTLTVVGQEFLDAGKMAAFSTLITSYMLNRSIQGLGNKFGF